MQNTLKEKKILPLSLAALGVVFGDIGTSPLYAFHESLQRLPLNTLNILGILSLIFWVLVLVVSIKYITIFLWADNRGEGGVLALLALLQRRKCSRIFLYLAVLGSGLLLGDGMITPAISVISAVEGLKVISPDFSHLVLPIVFMILLILFLSQSFGSGKIGSSFGPVLLLWFLIIGLLGFKSILQNLTVLQAVNPVYAVKFFYQNGWHAYITLGGVFLVITGGEALYADLGHFGRNPIRLGWFAVALPALLLNYFGQGACLLRNAKATINPFFSLSPTWFAYPLLAIATVATIIASQAVISASFSLAKQAVLLNLLPKISIIQTSKKEKGQVYVPKINFFLATGTLLLVVFFQSSTALAGAYGIAVNLVMIIVSLMVIFIAYYYWRWSLSKIILVFFLFGLIDIAFLGANFHKILKGGWIPLVFAIISSIIMLTWRKGIELLRDSYYMDRGDLNEIVRQFDCSNLYYLPKFTAIFIVDPSDKSGGSFFHFLKLNKIFPSLILIASVSIRNYPYISEKKRCHFHKLSDSIYRINLQYGFMQEINVPRSLGLAVKMKKFPFKFNLDRAIYSIEIVNITMGREKPKMFLWQKRLFTFLLRNSRLDMDFFNLPYNRTIVIGTYCKI